MRNLEGSGWMTNPDLSIIEAKAEEKSETPSAVTSESRALPYAFTLQVKLANPNAPDADGNVVAPVGGAPTDAAGGTPGTMPTPATPATTPPAATPATPPAPATSSPANTPVEPPAPTKQGSPAS